MKKLAFIFSVLVFVAGMSTTSCAQKEKEKKKEKKVKIKMEKEVDGKLTKIDTVFILKDGENIKDVLKKYNVDVEEGELHNIDVHIDSDGEGKKMVTKIIVEIDDDGEHKVKGKKGKKMMFISEDGEKHDLLMDVDEDFDHVYKFKTDGDSTKKVIIMSSGNTWVHDDHEDFNIVKKGEMHFISAHGTESWRKDTKPGDTVVVKTIVSINGKESDVKVKEIIVSKKDVHDPHKNVMIFHDDGKHKKIKKEIIITSDDNVEWNDKDENVFIVKKGGKMNTVKVKIDDVEKEGLKKLKLPKSIKPLEVSKLFINFTKGDKMNLSFEIKDKGNTTVKIFDDKGKVLFKDTKSNFSGKYKAEMKKMKGDMIIQVSQGNKFFHKELEIEY